MPEQTKLHVVPLSWRAACQFIAEHHRHHKPPRGQKFAIGVVTPTGDLVGVATCGRPVARHYDDGVTLEVNRSCTNGWPNANSFLYGACRKIAAAMGYSRILTYTEESESGASLRAAAWTLVGKRAARKSWAESTGTTQAKLKELRDPIGAGGVARTLWTQQTSSDSS